MLSFAFKPLSKFLNTDFHSNIRTQKEQKMGRWGETEDIVYEFVCENPGLSTYEISQKLQMSGGRVRYALNSLQKKGLIKFKFEKNNPRIKKLSIAVKAWELLPPALKKKWKSIRTRL